MVLYGINSVKFTCFASGLYGYMLMTFGILNALDNDNLISFSKYKETIYFVLISLIGIFGGTINLIIGIYGLYILPLLVGYLETILLFQIPILYKFFETFNLLGVQVAP